MNVAKAIELATAIVIREYAAIETPVTIRAWQSLATDPAWNERPDMTFPQIDVRCSPPRTDDNQATLNCACAVLVATMAADDKGHGVISDIFERVEKVMHALFSQFRLGVDGDELTRWKAVLAENVAASDFNFGGFTIGDALAPQEQEGVNMIGTTLNVHYSRADF